MSVLLCLGVLSAQTPHNFQINIGGGIHSLQYTANQCSLEQGYGFVAGVQYNYMFSDYFGVAVGAQVSKLQTSATYNYSQSLDRVHPDNSLDYVLDASFHDWKESQQALLLEIPIEGMFRYAFNSQWALQFGVGVALQLPVSGSFAIDDGYYTTTGYFPATDVTYADLANHGFQTSDGIAIDVDDKIEYKSFAMGIIADLGVAYSIGRNSAIYAGLYLNYGVMSLIDGVEQPLVDLHQYHGTFVSDRVSEVKPLQMGLKLAFRFGVGSNTH